MPSSYEGSDMPEHSENVYEEFQTLTVQDPRQARTRFCEMLVADAPELDVLLRHVSAPGDGRVRLLIANAVRGRPDKSKVVPFLLKWYENEPDEFAKRAIGVALEGVQVNPSPARQQLVDPNLVAIYRYVTDRLKHRLRNELMGPMAHIIRLRTHVDRIGDDQLRTDLSEILSLLDDSFQRVGYTVELDVDDEYFQWRSITLCDWLQSMNTDYSQRYSPIDFNIMANLGVSSAKIHASSYLLSTIFWNLWINSQQAVKDRCVITANVTTRNGHIAVLLTDNGTGFPQQLDEVAFRHQYSTSRNHSGRGLLEVQEAVEQLHGQVSLVNINGTELRVKISFPQEHK